MHVVDFTRYDVGSAANLLLTRVEFNITGLSTAAGTR